MEGGLSLFRIADILERAQKIAEWELLVSRPWETLSDAQRARVNALHHLLWPEPIHGSNE